MTTGYNAASVGWHWLLALTSIRKTMDTLPSDHAHSSARLQSGSASALQEILPSDIPDQLLTDKDLAWFEGMIETKIEFTKTILQVKRGSSTLVCRPQSA